MRVLLLSVLALPFALPAWAQTPAERASGMLQRELDQDRLRDAAEEARGDPVAQPPGRVQDLERDRASVQPRVGRPEEESRRLEILRSPGANPNITR